MELLCSRFTQPRSTPWERHVRIFLILCPGMLIPFLWWVFDRGPLSYTLSIRFRDQVPFSLRIGVYFWLNILIIFNYFWGCRYTCSLPVSRNENITVTRLYNTLQFFPAAKNKNNFLLKKINIFLIFAYSVHCWYKLKPPHCGRSNKYPQCTYYYLKWDASGYKCFQKMLQEWKHSTLSLF